MSKVVREKSGTTARKTRNYTPPPSTHEMLTRSQTRRIHSDPETPLTTKTVRKTGAARGAVQQPPPSVASGEWSSVAASNITTLSKINLAKYERYWVSHHDSEFLKPYYDAPVQPLTRSDHYRIQLLCQEVMAVSTPDEMTAIDAYTIYLRFVLTDCATRRLVRAHEQGYPLPQLLRIKARMKDMLNTIKIIDEKKQQKSEEFDLPEYRSLYRGFSIPMLETIQNLPIPGYDEQRKQGDPPRRGDIAPNRDQNIINVTVDERDIHPPPPENNEVDGAAAFVAQVEGNEGDDEQSDADEEDEFADAIENVNNTVHVENNTVDVEDIHANEEAILNEGDPEGAADAAYAAHLGAAQAQGANAANQEDAGNALQANVQNTQDGENATADPPANDVENAQEANQNEGEIDDPLRRPLNEDEIEFLDNLRSRDPPPHPEQFNNTMADVINQFASKHPPPNATGTTVKKRPPLPAFVGQKTGSFMMKDTTNGTNQNSRAPPPPGVGTSHANRNNSATFAATVNVERQDKTIPPPPGARDKTSNVSNSASATTKSTSSSNSTSASNATSPQNPLGTTASTSSKTKSLEPSGRTDEDPPLKKSGKSDKDPPGSDPSDGDDDDDKDKDRANRSRSRKDKKKKKKKRRYYLSSSSSDESDNVRRKKGEELDLNDTVVDDDWYQTLPVPWNITPKGKKNDKDDVKLVQKANLLSDMKFTGTVASYIEWRSVFISYVHSRRIPNYQKGFSLIGSMDKKMVPEYAPLRDLLMTRGPDVYRQAIETLERVYGGSRQLRTFYHSKIRDLAPLKHNDYHQITALLGLLVNIKSAFTVFRIQYELESSLLVDLIREKLPESYIDAYQVYMSLKYPDHEEELFTLRSLIEWLEDKRDRLIRDQRRREVLVKNCEPPKKPLQRPPARVHAVIQECSCSTPGCYYNRSEDERISDLSEDSEREQIYYSKKQNVSVIPECSLCPRVIHLYKKCPKFQAMTPQQRREHLLKEKKCFKCFRTGHSLRNCKTTIKCKDCGDEHNTLLCAKKSAQKVQVAVTSLAALGLALDSNQNLYRVPNETDTSGTNEELTDTLVEPLAGLAITKREKEDGTTMYTSAQMKVTTRFRCSLPIVAVQITNPVNKKKVQINALLDEGANRTSMSTAVASMIGLKGSRFTFRASGFGDSYTEDKDAIESEILIGDLGGSFQHRTGIICLSNPLGDLTPDNWQLLKQDWPHLKNLQLAPVLIDQQVQMIIGTDNVALLAAKAGDIIGKDISPGARKTVFGWVPRGRMYPIQPEASVNLVEDQIADLCINYKQFFVRTIEEPETRVLSKFQQSFDADKRERRQKNFQEIQSAYDKDLLELLRLQFRLDEAPNHEPDMSLEDRYAFRRMKASEVHTGERYQVDCLWRKGEPKLVHNKLNAIGRFQRLRRNPLYKEKYLPVYTKTLKDYLEKSYIEKVPVKEQMSTDSFYLPHFVVSKQTEDSTKYRIVFDGAAKYANKSLNDAMAKGPNFIADLVKVLLQFRRYPVALTMDVKEMFLQVGMDPKSRRYHRFVFQWPEDDHMSEYQFTRHPFGSTGSPCIAMHIVRQRALELQDRYPEAAKLILNYSIIDDAMTSVPDVQQAKRVYEGVKAILAACSMDVHKIASNNDDLLKSIPSVERAQGFDADDFIQDTCPSTYTLGMLWRSATDNYTFAAREIDTSGKITMRTILKHTASIFDPIGLISPFIVQARLIVQDCFEVKLGWDDEVPDEIASHWKDFAQEVRHLHKYSLPRCLEPEPAEVTIHIFSDASEKAYSAAVYLVARSPSGTVSTLIFSKTKVAPLDKLTIPRLELLGALEASKLAQTITSTYAMDPNTVHFWTDNQCVLAWIKLRTKVLKTFVGNRIETIVERSNPDMWRYVPTDQNPADIGSRGETITELSTSRLWNHGPGFILEPESNWPVQPPYYLPREAKQEIKMENLHDVEVNLASVLVNTHPPARKNEPWDWETVMKNFSSYNKLVKAVAWSRRYIKTLLEVVKGTKKKPEQLLQRQVQTLEMKFGKQTVKRKVKTFVVKLDFPTPTQDERRMAEILIQKQVQQIHLSSEVSDLLKNGKVKHTSWIRKFMPTMDEDNVIRQATRLQFNQKLRKELRYPVILPSSSRVVQLIIGDAHEESNHTRSINQTLRHLGEYRFTKGARTLIRKYIKECYRCRRLWPRPLGQRMGPLPDFRIPSGTLAPFNTTTIDAAGPFETRQGRGKARMKRYLLLFTCAMTRAVHIEVMNSVNTDDFLLALSRFCCERSVPKTIVCDNAGQFVKGARLLDSSADLDENKIERTYPKIKFMFIPARTPHVNGVTERMIGSMKTSLKHTITDGLLTDDELLTAAKKTQAILNARPLAYQGTSPEEPQPLTPAHFLADKALQDIDIPDENLDYRSRYRLVQKVMDDAWKNFQKDVLPKLNAVTKWHKDQPNLEIGDIVVVMDAEETGKFPLGVVTEIYPGHDGLVRIVKIRIRGHETKRHTSRLMLLVREPNSS